MGVSTRNRGKLPGLSSGPDFRLGTGSRGIEISQDSPGRDKKGYFKHGTVQDGIEPSRD